MDPHLNLAAVRARRPYEHRCVSTRLRRRPRGLAAASCIPTGTARLLDAAIGEMR